MWNINMMLPKQLKERPYGDLINQWMTWRGWVPTLDSHHRPIRW